MISIISLLILTLLPRTITLHVPQITFIHNARLYQCLRTNQREYKLFTFKDGLRFGDNCIKGTSNLSCKAIAHTKQVKSFPWLYLVRLLAVTKKNGSPAFFGWPSIVHFPYQYTCNFFIILPHYMKHHIHLEKIVLLALLRLV